MQNKFSKSVHQVSGSIADSIMIQAALEKSMDNLTIVIISFQNLLSFLNDKPQLQQHLFQIKEVESNSTSQNIISSDNSKIIPSQQPHSQNTTPRITTPRINNILGKPLGERSAQTDPKSDGKFNRQDLLGDIS